MLSNGVTNNQFSISVLLWGNIFLHFVKGKIAKPSTYVIKTVK